MSGKATHSSFMTIIVLSCIFILGQGCIEYVSEPLPPQGSTSTSLMVIIHGAGFSPDDWPLQIETAIDARLSAQERESWDIVRYGWQQYANDPLGAANAGLELGSQVGLMLAGTDYDYEQIHFIAQGIGSAVGHSAATAYLNNATLPGAVHTTYLDPVSLPGVHSTGVDFSESYFNDNDPVLSTNIAISSSHNFNVTDFMLRDVGTAAGHIWPVNFYLQTIEDERLLYGFQFSPMVSTTPPDYTEFPAGETTRLFDQVPVVTVSLSTGDMDLPIRYTECSAINTFFDADRAAVEARLVDTPFQLATWSGNSTVIGLGFFEYRESNIGPYSEVGLVIPVVLKGAPLPSNWFLDLTLPALDRVMGFYVLNIPADSASAVAAGEEVWGFNKFLTDIDFGHAGSSIDMTVHDPDSSTTILNFAGSVGSGTSMPGASSVTLSEVDGIPLKTINHVVGTTAAILDYDIVLTVGESDHPMAQNLRDLGVDGTSPTMMTISTDYQSVLYFGEPM